MTTAAEQAEKEMHDLREEIEQFKREKERVRSIVGTMGGMPSFNTKVFNIVFSVVVGGCLVVSIALAQSLQFILGELAIAAVSVKLIYLLHSQTRVNHFQLWILSSIEWRLNESVKKLTDLHTELKSSMSSQEPVP